MNRNTGLIVVDHGSRRLESNQLLEEFVANLRQELPFETVEPAHMELAEPSIATAFDRCVAAGVSHVVVFPYFLSPGRHWKEDIPELVASAAKSHPGVEYLVTSPFGLHPQMASVMMARVQHCLDHTDGQTDACEYCRGTDRCQFRAAPEMS